MRASQITAGLFAGALALLGVMSTAEKPYTASGDDSIWDTETPPATTAAPKTTAPTQASTTEHYVGICLYAASR